MEALGITRDIEYGLPEIGVNRAHGFECPGFEDFFAEFVPESFFRIEFRRIARKKKRKKQKCDVTGNDEVVAAVVGRAVEKQQNVLPGKFSYQHLEVCLEACCSLSMTSVVSPRGALRFKVVRGGAGAGGFFGFLKRMAHGWRRPVYLVSDGNLLHHSKQVTAYVVSLQGNLRLVFLPPYSPELNPGELVWNNGKSNRMGHTLVHKPTDLVSAVISTLRYLQKPPAIVRPFSRPRRHAMWHAHSRQVMY